MENEKYDQLVNQAFQMFNAQMNTDYSFDNVEVLYLTAENADKEIAEFLKMFPDDVEEEMLEPGYYKKIKGEAFVTENKFGFVVRTDIEERGLYWRHIVLHELSHIYCVTHELKDGSNFFKRYCIGNPEESSLDGIINGGYAIWREFVAEFLARLLDFDMADFALRGNTKEINGLLDEIAGGKPFIKTRITDMLLSIMTSKEIIQAPDKEAAFEKLKRFNKLQTCSWQRLLGTVYDQVFDPDKDVWEIDYDFIECLGNNYMSLCMEVVYGLMGDSRDVEKANRIMGRMIATKS